MSTIEYAAKIKKNPRTVQNWCNAGLIGKRVGGRWEIDEGTKPPTKDSVPPPVTDLDFEIFEADERSKGVDVVYIIQIVGQCLVKIGFTSSLQHRLSSLRTASPHALKLLVAYEAPKEHERELHIRFNNDRVRCNGEWFRYSRDIQSFIIGVQRAAL